jgi:hypothetical protein
MRFCVLGMARNARKAESVTGAVERRRRSRGGETGSETMSRVSRLALLAVVNDAGGAEEDREGERGKDE